MDEITLKLNSPITEEQWDDINDVDFEHTDRIWFHTKHDKDVEFVKVLRCKDCIWLNKHTNGIGFCAAWGGTTYEDYYCSKAERGTS